jgi:hypothetical protein
MSIFTDISVEPVASILKIGKQPGMKRNGVNVGKGRARTGALSSSTYFSSPKIETIDSSETSVTINHTAIELPVGHY